MKTILVIPVVLASMATLAFSREFERDATQGALPRSLSDHREFRNPSPTDADPDPVAPASFPSPEPRSLAESESSFSIGPAVGYLQARGADRGTWFGGVQARLHFARILAAEASISFHSSRYEDGDVVVTQVPVQLTAFLYPFPDGPIRPYILGGVGWYYTHIQYDDSFSTISDETEHFFGVHLGAGVELMLGPRTSLDLNVRYIFINATNQAVIDQEFNYWQLTLGLNFFF